MLNRLMDINVYYLHFLKYPRIHEFSRHNFRSIYLTKIEKYFRFFIHILISGNISYPEILKRKMHGTRIDTSIKRTNFYRRNKRRARIVPNLFNYQNCIHCISTELERIVHSLINFICQFNSNFPLKIPRKNPRIQIVNENTRSISPLHTTQSCNLHPHERRLRQIINSDKFPLRRKSRPTTFLAQLEIEEETKERETASTSSRNVHSRE